MELQHAAGETVIKGWRRSFNTSGRGFSKEGKEQKASSARGWVVKLRAREKGNIDERRSWGTSQWAVESEEWKRKRENQKSKSMKEGGEKDRSSVPFKEVYPLSHRNAHTPKAHLSTSDLMKTAIKRRKEKGQARPIWSHTCSSTRLVQTHVGCTVNQQHITDSWYTWRRDASVYHDRTPLNWTKACYVWSCQRIAWLMQLARLGQRSRIVCWFFAA